MSYDFASNAPHAPLEPCGTIDFDINQNNTLELENIER